MDSLSYSSSSSSSSYVYEERKIRQTSSSRSTVHSVRKAPMKPTVTKKQPIAPLPPTPPKIYRVDPVNFREVVQKLTGAEYQQTRLREVAPPPISLPPAAGSDDLRAEVVVHPSMTLAAPFSEGNNEGNNKDFGDVCGSPFGFSLSPNTLAWCSSLLFSPGTLA